MSWSLGVVANDEIIDYKAESIEHGENVPNYPKIIFLHVFRLVFILHCDVRHRRVAVIFEGCVQIGGATEDDDNVGRLLLYFDSPRNIILSNFKTCFSPACTCNGCQGRKLLDCHAYVDEHLNA